MLILCNIERWDGMPNKERETILNTRRMSKLEETATGSFLYYSYPEGHRRGNLHPIFIDKTPAEINTMSEMDVFDRFITLPVYPKDDTSVIPIDINFKIRDILRVTKYDDSHSWIWIHHNEVIIERFLVMYSLQEIYNLTFGGSVTTTTTEDWSSYWNTLFTEDSLNFLLTEDGLNYLQYNE